MGCKSGKSCSTKKPTSKMASKKSTSKKKGCGK